MICKEKCIVVDVDGTLCPVKRADQQYWELTPNSAVLEALKKYRDDGFRVIVTTSRNMRTYDGNIGEILANTAPVLLDWLKRHEVPFDEVHFGKPWPGKGGFYVDDCAIRPSEFVRLSYSQIQDLLKHEKAAAPAER